MFAIEMNLEELRMLVDMLERELRDLRSEEHHTDNRRYKEKLKMKEKLIRHMLDEADHVKFVKSA